VVSSLYGRSCASVNKRVLAIFDKVNSTLVKLVVSFPWPLDISSNRILNTQRLDRVISQSKVPPLIYYKFSYSKCIIH